MSQDLALFTVIANFENGHYTSQFRADSFEAAILKWIEHSDQLIVFAEDLIGFQNAVDEIRLNLTDFDLKPNTLTGLVNVCDELGSFSDNDTDERHLFLSIVKTES